MPRVRGVLPLAASLLIATGAVALLAYSSTLNPIDAILGRGAIVTVPGVEGLALPRAESDIEAAGLTVEVQSGFSLTAPRGTIIRQDPASGERVREGDVVDLVVSQGANRVQMPDAVGRPLAEAGAPLEEAGVEFQVESVPSERVPEGVVIEQSPDPGVVVTGIDTPRFEVSAGPPERPVPEVVGLSVEAASFRLGDAGFVVPEVRLVDDLVLPSGAIVAADPPVGTMLARDARVSLSVSVGPPPVAVPDVTNVTRATAVERLEGLGFVVRVAARLVGSDGAGVGAVFEQEPAAGSQLRPGQVVTIVVGRPPPSPPPRATTTTAAPPASPPAATSPPASPPTTAAPPPPGGGGGGG